MIDLDRPPVADRPLPDPAALRQTTLLAARRVGPKPVRRGHRLVLVLVAAALLSAVLVGALRTVPPARNVAGPPTPPPVVTPLPEGARLTDLGPATSAQVQTATRICLRNTGQAAVQRTLLARRVDDGSGATTALVLHLVDGTTVGCRTDGSLNMMSTLNDRRADPADPAIRVGSGGTWTVATDAYVVDRSSVVLSVSAEIAAVDVVATDDDGVDHRFRAEPVDGWVYVPVVTRRPMPADGRIPPLESSEEVIAYDAYGNRVPVQTS